MLRDVSDVIVGADGLARCPWSAGSPEYLAYHDEEWGRPLRGDNQLFERVALEAFQSGLSWITILRKRENFRALFAGFEIKKVAAFEGGDVERLLAEPGIVRNRAKIEATIGNARAALELPQGLSAFLWEFVPPARKRRLRTGAEVPAITPESTAMAKALKQHGFRFVGPTTAYALMQATGMVDDHLRGCHVRT